MRFAWYWNQWLVGVMYDRGRILTDFRWLVCIIGPLTISIPLPRSPR